MVGTDNGVFLCSFPQTGDSTPASHIIREVVNDAAREASGDAEKCSARFSNVTDVKLAACIL